jgi:hypothetical protein
MGFDYIYVHTYILYIAVMLCMYIALYFSKGSLELAMYVYVTYIYIYIYNMYHRMNNRTVYVQSNDHLHILRVKLIYLL